MELMPIHSFAICMRSPVPITKIIYLNRHSQNARSAGISVTSLEQLHAMNGLFIARRRYHYHPGKQRRKQDLPVSPSVPPLHSVIDSEHDLAILTINTFQYPLLVDAEQTFIPSWISSLKRCAEEDRTCGDRPEGKLWRKQCACPERVCISLSRRFQVYGPQFHLAGWLKASPGLLHIQTGIILFQYHDTTAAETGCWFPTAKIKKRSFLPIPSRSGRRKSSGISLPINMMESCMCLPVV